MNFPEYLEEAVREALVNAIVHRDYTMLGSEVHVDLFDDRLEIVSPGGMERSVPIQELTDLNSVSLIRRNPVVADIFGRMNYMERRGSGFRKIREAYASQAVYRPEVAPAFRSSSRDFTVILYNLNYGVSMEVLENAEAPWVTASDASREEPVSDPWSQVRPILEQIGSKKLRNDTKDAVRGLLMRFGLRNDFSRANVAEYLGMTPTAAGRLIKTLKDCELIVEAGHKRRYRFFDSGHEECDCLP